MRSLCHNHKQLCLLRVHHGIRLGEMTHISEQDVKSFSLSESTNINQVIIYFLMSGQNILKTLSSLLCFFSELMRQNSARRPSASQTVSKQRPRSGHLKASRLCSHVHFKLFICNRITQNSQVWTGPLCLCIPNTHTHTHPKDFSRHSCLNNKENMTNIEPSQI